MVCLKVIAEKENSVLNLQSKVLWLLLSPAERKSSMVHPAFLRKCTFKLLKSLTITFSAIFGGRPMLEVKSKCHIFFPVHLFEQFGIG